MKKNSRDFLFIFFYFGADSGKTTKLQWSFCSNVAKLLVIKFSMKKIMGY